jgi:hypothetical protein
VDKEWILILHPVNPVHPVILAFHFALLVLLRGYSVCANRNRTAPRMITAVNVPDATSLSTMRQEQASKFATCFLVSCNPQNRFPLFPPVQKSTVLFSTSLCILNPLLNQSISPASPHCHPV